MALQIGSGEPVARVRRGLDIKGRVNLGLDETIVPVASAIDLTQPPIRRTPVRWWVAANVAADAAERPQLRVFHQNRVDQLITGFWLQTNAAASILVGQGLAGAAGGVPARTTEIVDANNGGVVSRQIGIQSIATTQVGASISNAFLRLQVPQIHSEYFAAEIVIPAMPNPEGPVTNAPAILFEGTQLNRTLQITVTGLYFDALPLDFRT